MPDDTTPPVDPNNTDNAPVGMGDDTKQPEDGDTPFTPAPAPDDNQYTDHPATDSNNDTTEQYNDGVAAAAGEEHSPDSDAVGGYTPPAGDEPAADPAAPVAPAPDEEDDADDKEDTAAGDDSQVV